MIITTNIVLNFSNIFMKNEIILNSKEFTVNISLNNFVFYSFTKVPNIICCIKCIYI